MFARMCMMERDDNYFRIISHYFTKEPFPSLEVMTVFVYMDPYVDCFVLSVVLPESRYPLWPPIFPSVGRA